MRMVLISIMTPMNEMYSHSKLSISKQQLMLHDNNFMNKKIL
jgi:hypothetical protein